MKKPIVVLLLALLTVTVRAALPQPDLVTEIYFAGEQKIFAAPNVKSFTNEFCSANALALRKQTCDKLAPWLAHWVASHTRMAAPNGGALFRPLLDDLQSAEWMAEARASGNGPADVALAIRLSDDRIQAWTAALKPFLPAGTFNSSGGWLIIDAGTGSPKLGDDLAQKATGPHAGWFTLDINFPHLAQWYPEVGRLGLPETQFTVTAPDNDFRINGTFYYPQPLALNLTPWQFPTNLVHCPFNSFTAARGFSSWLGSQSWAQPYDILPVPNQAFTWSLPGLPYQWYFATPVPDATNAVNQVFNRWQPQLLSQAATGESEFAYSLDKNDNAVRLEGLPLIKPMAVANHERSGDFLFVGGFQNSRRSEPLPAQLFNRLNTPNLVFYHFENTKDREASLLQCVQLWMVATRHVQLDGNTAGYRWFAGTTPALGPTDTEIVQNAPDQLGFARKAPGIFTCLELYAISSWLEAKNFPGCDLDSPPLPPQRQMQLKAKRAGIIMLPLSH